MPFLFSVLSAQLFFSVKSIPTFCQYCSFFCPLCYSFSAHSFLFFPSPHTPNPALGIPFSLYSLSCLFCFLSYVSVVVVFFFSVVLRPSVSQGRICLDNRTCCHTKLQIELSILRSHCILTSAHSGDVSTIFEVTCMTRPEWNVPGTISKNTTNKQACSSLVTQTTMMCLI